MSHRIKVDSYSIYQSANSYTIRFIERNELPQLLLLYRHLNPVDAPLPADDVLQSMWDAILNDPHLFYIVADLASQKKFGSRLSPHG